MFYSHQLLLARKPSLGQIRMVATLHDRIKLNIVEICDEILNLNYAPRLSGNLIDDVNRIQAELTEGTSQAEMAAQDTRIQFNRAELDKLNVVQLCEIILDSPDHKPFSLLGILMNGIIKVYREKINRHHDDATRLQAEFTQLSLNREAGPFPALLIEGTSKKVVILLDNQQTYAVEIERQSSNFSNAAATMEFQETSYFVVYTSISVDVVGDQGFKEIDESVSREVDVTVAAKEVTDSEDAKQHSLDTIINVDVPGNRGFEEIDESILRKEDVTVAANINVDVPGNRGFEEIDESILREEDVTVAAKEVTDSEDAKQHSVDTSINVDVPGNRGFEEVDESILREEDVTLPDAAGEIEPQSPNYSDVVAMEFQQY